MNSLVKAEGRLFFVSDVHGELPTLLHGLKELGYDKDKDTVIHAGDMIDRGRYSLETAKYIMKHFHSVLGNHDVFAINQFQSLDWLRNGGDWALETDPTEMDELKKEISKLPYAITVEHQGFKYGVVHASTGGILNWPEFTARLEKDWRLQESAVWDRYAIQYQCDFNIEGVDAVIHGHTPLRNPMRLGNRYYIDTGLVYGKSLTISEAVEGKLEFHKVELV